jgi:hypothetical protein
MLTVAIVVSRSHVGKSGQRMATPTGIQEKHKDLSYGSKGTLLWWGHSVLDSDPSGALLTCSGREEQYNIH